MRHVAIFVVSFCCVAASHADKTALIDAKEAVDAVLEKVEESVVFCPRCRAAGTRDEQPCPRCDGHGVVLVAEEKLIREREKLVERAARAGAPAESYEKYDVAKRLPELKEEIESDAFKMLIAYVEYVKVCREHADGLAEDPALKQQAEERIPQMDRLIDRVGPALNIPSLKILGEEDPTGKVGAFNLYGSQGLVRVDGEPATLFEMRHPKGYSLLLRGEPKKRTRCVVAEILGKGDYEIEGGRKIKAVLMQAH